MKNKLLLHKLLLFRRLFTIEKNQISMWNNVSLQFLHTYICCCTLPIFASPFPPSHPPSLLPFLPPKLPFCSLGRHTLFSSSCSTSFPWLLFSLSLSLKSRSKTGEKICDVSLSVPLDLLVSQISIYFLLPHVFTWMTRVSTYKKICSIYLV